MRVNLEIQLIMCGLSSINNVEKINSKAKLESLIKDLENTVNVEKSWTFPKKSWTFPKKSWTSTQKKLDIKNIKQITRKDYFA